MNEHSVSAASSVVVRPFERGDVPQVLDMMRALAQFERYLDDYKVTETAILEHGFGPNAKFEVLVATSTAEPNLLGMAVIYVIPWTYDLQPSLVLKELFVSDTARGGGVGTALFRAVAQRASDLGCPRLQWTVLHDNEPAKTFYRSHGGKPDPIWQPWLLDEAAIAKLVD